MKFRRFLLFLAIFACICAAFAPNGPPARAYGGTGDAGELPDDGAQTVHYYFNAYVLPTLQNDIQAPPARRVDPADAKELPSAASLLFESARRDEWTDANGNPILGVNYLQSVGHPFALGHSPI